MDPDKLITDVIDIIQGNPVIGIAIIAALSILAFFKPKAVLKFVISALFLAVALYLLLLVIQAMSTGVDKKGEMINRTRHKLD